MKNRLYSAVVDCSGIFPSQAQRLVWSLTELAGVGHDRIILHLVNTEADPIAVSILESLGVEVFKIDAYPGHRYCNKIQQLPVLVDRVFDEVVLLDCDVIVIEEPPCSNGGVLAKPVDFGNPTADLLKQIFATAGLQFRPASADIDGALTAFGNANGGVYVIAKEIFGPLAIEWRFWASWCLQNKVLFKESWVHIDQVSFAMAVESLEVPYGEMHRRFNLPTHVSQPANLDCTPAIIHYHRAIDSQQMLLPVEGLPKVNAVIQVINERWLDYQRVNFCNAAFWNCRYLLDAELGSGIGSRGRFLLLKQEIIRNIVQILDVEQLLDVGGGDGATASDVSNYVRIKGIDISSASRELYLASVKEAEWDLHDITSDPYMADVDAIMCFDVLIHLPMRDEYIATVRNLLQLGVPVIVSGYDAPPVDFGPMTFFHEPLSVTLEGLGFIAFPLAAYRELMVFVALPALKPRRQNDLCDSTLKLAIPYVSQPKILLEAILSSWHYLGFFPDHLPRCIEYPWVIEQLSADASMNIVDVGAGVSVLPFMLCARGHMVTTVDAHSMVRDIQDRDSWNEWGYLDYSLLDKKITSVHARYEDLIISQKIDALVSVSVLEHLPKAVRLEWISRSFSQLKPGGYFLLTIDTVPFSRLLWNYSEGEQVEDHLVHGTVDDLVQEFIQFGYQVEVFEHLQWLPRTRVGMARIKAVKPLG